ncbi:MAG: acetyl-CoA carboxylase carboxyltransferase subunit alpha [Bryobacteraceae bacterium]|nr:acetyl-CoA carboxylase carboxyltransferase subunit alpha [Solibacteraceae bacterium]MCO5352815.1 acetyl-CoA carboxylase carboxyltransferase subunit alpha [Bryobacteraceae bacterium]
MSDPNASQRIADLELEIARLQQSSTGARAQVHELQAELKKLQGEEGVNLSWQRVQMARHPKRPHSLDYIERLVPDFTEIHGDRAYGEDAAIICGFGTIAGSQAMIIGQEKGRDTKQKLHRNFGMPKPEGYRKALRAMQMAEKFRRPVITFLDTPGAYPGIDAEERGQAQAIALNLREMARLETPIIVVVIGEGGSGGALALGIGNRVLMLENAVYSVISPESCAAIIYRDAAKGNIAAAALRITAGDLERLQLIDGIIPEPPGGAHEDYDRAADLLREALAGALRELAPLPGEELVKQRYRRFREIGNFFEESAG